MNYIMSTLPQMNIKKVAKLPVCAELYNMVQTKLAQAKVLKKERFCPYEDFCCMLVDMCDYDEEDDEGDEEEITLSSSEEAVIDEEIAEAEEEEEEELDEELLESDDEEEEEEEESSPKKVQRRK